MNKGRKGNKEEWKEERKEIKEKVLNRKENVRQIFVREIFQW